MSRNSSGTYTLPAGNPVVSGTLIEASWANTTLSDIASALTDSLSRSGEGGMTAALRLFDGTVSSPGLAFSNETSTGLYRAGSGDMRLAVTGSLVMQFLSTGVAVTGTLGASGNFAINTDKFTVAASSGNTAVAGTLGVTGAATLSSTLAVTGASTFSGQTVTLENSTAYYPQLINRNKTNDANGSYMVLEKIRSSAVVQSGDVLGNLIFRGYDGTQYLQGAYINALISATPGTNDMPTDLVFGTTADGGSGPAERMRITQAGNMGIGNASPSKKLDVTGIIRSNGATDDNFQCYDGTTTTSLQQSSNYLYFNNNVDSATAGGFSWRTTNSYTTRMVLNSSGNLGLGATPSAWYTGYTAMNIGYSGAIWSNRTSADTNVTMVGNNAYLNSNASNWTYQNNGYANRLQMDSGAFKFLTAPSGTAGGTATFTQAMTIQASGGLSFANTTDVGAYNTVLGLRNNHFTGQRSNTVAAGATSTMLTLLFDANGAAIVRVVDCGTIIGNNYFTNVYEYFVTCYNGTVTATLKQSQIGSGAGSMLTTSTSASTFNVIQTGNASAVTWHDTAVDVLAVSAGNGEHKTVSITMAANN